MTDYEEIVREIINMKNTTPAGFLKPVVVYEHRLMDYELRKPKYNFGNPSRIREAFKDLIEKILEESK